MRKSPARRMKVLNNWLFPGWTVTRQQSQKAFVIPTEVEGSAVAFQPPSKNAYFRVDGYTLGTFATLKEREAQSGISCKPWMALASSIEVAHPASVGGTRQLSQGIRVSIQPCLREVDVAAKCHLDCAGNQLPHNDRGSRVEVPEPTPGQSSGPAEVDISRAPRAATQTSRKSDSHLPRW
jgi:hypothetical protein